MIHKIFFDLDETLVHTEFDEHPGHDCVVHIDADGLGPVYFTTINKEAYALIEYANALVGNENVYILTAAGKDYASRINKEANFGILEENIFGYSDIKMNTIPSFAWNCHYVIANEKIANPNNILIDNLEIRYNESKCSYIGIRPDRYIEVKDFNSTDFEDYSYLEQVKYAIEAL